MFSQLLFTYLLGLLLPCLGSAYPSHANDLTRDLKARAGSQSTSDDRLIQPGIVTLPYGGNPRNFSGIGLNGLGQQPSAGEPFGPNENEPWPFDQRIEIWGSNVYVEAKGELHPNLDCDIDLSVHVLFTYKIGSYHFSLSKGLTFGLHVRVVDLDGRIYAHQSQGYNHMIIEIQGSVYVVGKGKKYFHVQKEMFRWPTKAKSLRS